MNKIDKELKMDVILDMDGTIINSDEAICAYYNNEMHTHPDFVPANSDLIYFYSMKHQCPLWSLEERISAFATDFFWENVTIKENAYDVITRLCNDDRYNVKLWSYGTLKNMAKKSKWLLKDETISALVEEGKLEVLLSTHNTDKPTDKGVICDFGVLLDDHEGNLTNGKAYNIIMADKGTRDFNRHFTGDRVQSWINFEYRVNEIYEKEFLKYVLDNNIV